MQYVRGIASIERGFVALAAVLACECSPGAIKADETLVPFLEEVFGKA